MDEIKNFLQDKKSVIIILPPSPTPDLISAGLSLHHTLVNSAKVSQIGSDGPILPSVDTQKEVVDSIGSKNLIISFDYPEEYLEKVDYDVLPGGKFCLMIRPKGDSPVPKTSDVKYSYSGASADLAIVLGINSLEELGKIYADEKKFLDDAKVLSLNNVSTSPSFTPNIFHHPLSSFSELVALFIEKASLNPSSIAASNLIKQIYQSTNNLTDPKTTADTFSSISFLMKSGGQLPGATTNPFYRSVALAKDGPPPFFEPLSSPDNAVNHSEALAKDGPIPSDWTSPKIFRANS